MFFILLNRKPAQKPVTQLELDHQRLLKQENSLRKDMANNASDN